MGSAVTIQQVKTYFRRKNSRNGGKEDLFRKELYHYVGELNKAKD